MSPITHLLASWTISESCTVNRRERLWICLAGLAPDLDGLGIGVDIANDLLGRGFSQWYAVYHHFLFHGLFGALVTVALARSAGVRRMSALFLVFISFHLHLLCDLVGARGPERYDIWVIYYLGPFTRTWKLYWEQQWPLNGWPNFLITVALMAWTVSRAIRNGASPVSLFNSNWDATVVATFRRWWAQARPAVTPGCPGTHL
jgi:inner membrane protein